MTVEARFADLAVCVHAQVNLDVIAAQGVVVRERDIVRVERDYEGAEVVLVSYGAVSRAARMAANLAREQGLPVGTLRLITPWPFPGEEIEEMARKAKKVIVLENNLGQLYPFIKAEAACHADVSFLPPRVIGEIQDPEAILERIREVLK